MKILLGNYLMQKFWTEPIQIRLCHINWVIESQTAILIGFHSGTGIPQAA